MPHGFGLWPGHLAGKKASQRGQLQGRAELQTRGESRAQVQRVQRSLWPRRGQRKTPGTLQRKNSEHSEMDWNNNSNKSNVY